MKVKRYVGTNSREAFAKVKKELGPDAVILSNRPVTEGVEILALAQGDVASVIAPDIAHRPAFAAQSGYTNRRPDAERFQQSHAGASSLKEFAERGHGRTPVEQRRPLDLNAAYAPAGRAYEGVRAAPDNTPQNAANVSPAGMTNYSSQPTAMDSAAMRAAMPKVAAEPQAAQAAQTTGNLVMAEIKAMRGDFEKQLAAFAWNEGARRRPLRTKLMRELINAGFSAPLGRKISAALPDDYSEAEARAWLRSVLARNMRCDGEADDMVRRGGVYALVGPTGVGKTTTVAKLAARCVVRFGAQKLALISTDTYRIGAQDQLAIYAKILGVQVHAAQDSAGLERILRAVGGSHMVLIDTVGMGQRDTRLAEQLALLAGRKVQRMLLLNAACQLETLEDVIRVYKGNSDLSGAIITKLDEARRPGGVLDVAMRHKLKLAYVTDGQRVPEDIHLPVAKQLVERSLDEAMDSPFALEDDEFILLPEGAASKAGRT